MTVAPPSPRLLRSRSRQHTDFRVGCASWLDASLLAESDFYPARRMSAEQRLRWYARFFRDVEVNATFYGLPTERNSLLWIDRTPDDFRFGVKAYALMTGHHVPPERLPPSLVDVLPRDARRTRRGEIDATAIPGAALDVCFRAFREALAPLQLAGKLGYVLFQLAPWIGYARQPLDYLATLPSRLPGFEVAVEFRNSSWIPRHTDEVLSFLARHRLGYVGVDCPWQPLVPAVTADVAVLRLHGRNSAGWEAQLRGERPTVAEKYDYLYGPEELAGLAATARAFDGTVRTLHVTFNNNRADYPVRNALAFRRLLGQEVPDPESVRPVSRAARR
jgi:uncharacterized protein YecE (DUF72 family)